MKDSTDMIATSDLEVSTTVKVDENANLKIGADTSIWLVLYDSDNELIDYAIFEGRYDLAGKTVPVLE